MIEIPGPGVDVFAPVQVSDSRFTNVTKSDGRKQTGTIRFYKILLFYLQPCLCPFQGSKAARWNSQKNAREQDSASFHLFSLGASQSAHLCAGEFWLKAS